MEVAAEKMRARGGPDDSPRGAADHAAAEGEEAVGDLVRGGAGQEDGLRQEARTRFFPDLQLGANF